MYDVYGTICGSYEEACIVAGVDTPAQIAAEIMYQNAEDEIERLNKPVTKRLCTQMTFPDYGDNEIPF